MKEERKKDDLEEELAAVQTEQRDLLAKRGRLEAEAEVIYVPFYDVVTLK